MGLRDTSLGGGGGYEVFYLAPSIQLWNYAILRQKQLHKFPLDEINSLKSSLPANPKDVPLTRCEKPLDTAVAQRITSAWIGVLRETRYLPAETGIGLDGTTYHFSGYHRPPGKNYNEGFFAGQTWSPDPDTKPGRLAKLASSLVQYCYGKTEAAELEKQADALVERLDK